jgi:hypothetical protein
MASGRTVLATVVMGAALLGATACNPSGNRPTLPSSRPSVELSATRTREAETPNTPPSPSARPTRSEAVLPTPPAESPTPTEVPTKPPPTTAVAAPPTTAAAAPPPTTAAATPPSPTPAASAAAATTPSNGLGPLAWILLAALVAAVIGGVLIWRARRRSAWDEAATAVEADTRTATATRLPPVLTMADAASRALSWPPVRASLVDLVGRWDRLAQQAPDSRRKDRATWLRGVLQDLVAAVDAENEALANGRDATLLRPRVEDAERALSAALSAQTQVL